jgi:small-conductance mechanosensitive channel
MNPAQSINDYIYPALVMLVTFGAGYAIRQVFFKFLAGWTEKTETKIVDIVADAVKKPFLMWAVLIGIFFAMKATRLPRETTAVIDKSLLIVWVISLAFVLSRILSGFIQEYSRKVESTLAVSSLSRNVSNIFVFGIAFLIILNQLGISITPILTALGVGGLAVALALQDTLSNLFSGVHTIMSKQVRVGDYIALDTGQEGYITDIGWRATKIRMLSNSIIIVPNSKLASAIVVNHYMPEKEGAVLVQVGIDYGSDLGKVERVTKEVGKEVMKTVQGGIPDFEPFIRYHTFGDSSINFTVILRGKEFTDKFLITHEFIKRLKKRYDDEGIVIPFPIRTVHLQK